jgi:hypothetical protein
VAWFLPERRVTARAIARAADLAPVLKELREAGTTSLGGIARARGIPTAPEGKEWTAMQVARTLARLPTVMTTNDAAAQGDRQNGQQ